ncbi:hypothetical protein CFB50_17500 [Burkholderia sp. AU33423]|nr:hypothetical protein CFB50_17500 [Burkholderia sp. AU33423]
MRSSASVRSRRRWSVADPEIDNNNLDPADRTPEMIRSKRAASVQAYKSDDCIPCGGIVHVGFFFDGYRRSRNEDDPATSRFSNICRLFEAHRDKDDRRRQTPTYSNELWYRYYYSGIGTDLNSEAKIGVLDSTGNKVTKTVESRAAERLKGLPGQISGSSRLKIDPEKTMQEGIKKGWSELSFKPVAAAFNDIVKTAEQLPDRVLRMVKMMSADRYVRRGRAVLRSTLYEFAEHPWKFGWTFVKGTVITTGLDSIPWFRDSRALARVMGTGVQDRVTMALEQFEKTFDDALKERQKLQRIQVSIFAADRGAVVARVFANELAEKYKRRSASDLAIRGVPIEIKFMGLFDAVSSVMEENKLLSALPVLDLLKQNFGDLSLAVPAAVQRCVHFAAAHELRFYQRLDSLEKTRGEQYLYPGTSEDVTGGAPPGSLGARAELQRIPLRDMLNAAYEAGVAIDSMELLYKYKPLTYQRFSLARRISEGGASYTMLELINAYQKIVPRKPGLDFQAHMQVFIRWIAVRYQSPAFRSSVTQEADRFKAEHQRLLKAKQDAQAAYDAERRRPFGSTKKLIEAQSRLDDANRAEDIALRKTRVELARPAESVWERLEREAAEMTQRAARQDSLKRAAERVKTQRIQPWGTDVDTSVRVIEESLLSPDQVALAKVWSEAVAGKNPLPAEVMALFDFLVHDTMLTSWHDHLLSGPLYFQTRATDTFGTTDFAAEKKQHDRDERRAKHADRQNQTIDASTPARLPGI